jgi:acyl-CoA thioesterase-1
MVLTSVALLACGGGEESPPEALPDRSSTEEPRLPPDGSPSAARVVIVGTSLTAGMGLSDPVAESWAGQLQWMADSAGITARMTNAGVSGDTSAGGLRRLEWLLEDRPADVVVVELGANDGMRGLDLEALEANLRAMVRVTRNANPDASVVLAGMEAPPNLGEAYTAGFRGVFLRVAEDLDVALIPFLLDGVAGVAELNQGDGIHPTPEGHRRMARTAWSVLEPVLREAARRAGNRAQERS